MPLVVPCVCGKRLTGPDHFAGRKAKCPHCGQIVAFPANGGTELAQGAGTRTATKPPPKEDIPEVSPADDDDDDPGFEVVEDTPAKQRIRADKPGPASRKGREEVEEIEEIEEIDEVDDSPREKPKKKKKPKQKASSSGSGSMTSAGVGGGILLMIGAVVWFVVGLYGGYIFFYPPVLFVIGLVAVIKGLMS